jgi:zinc transporter ZupT
VTDEDHVERVRRTVQLLERWRRPLQVLWLTTAVASIGSLGAMAYLLELLMQGNRNPLLIQGFIVGVLLGAMAGLLVVKAAHALASSLKPLRTERLLLRYHDALMALANEHANAEEDKCLVSQ